MTTLILLVGVVVALDLFGRRIWPTRVCPTCRGAGETGPGPHALRQCWRCGGTKRVRRWFSGPPRT